MTELREVRLVAFPLRLHRAATEHHEELMREFQLLALDVEAGRDVPKRLVRLVEELTRSYGSVTAAPDAERDAALARGDESVDLTYRVPPEAAAACAELDRMLDEADDFCRAERLLTLEPTPEQVAFRKWYLGEFQHQLAGGEPRPWPAVTSAA